MIGSNNLSNSKLETKILRFQAFRRTRALTDNTITNGKSKATVKLQKNKTKLKMDEVIISSLKLKITETTVSDFLNGRTSTEHIIRSENTIKCCKSKTTVKLQE